MLRPFYVSSWKVDPVSREVSDSAKTTSLSPRAMEVLKLLAAAAGEVVYRDTILESVWPDVVVGEESVTTAVSELRRAFGETRGTAKVIETIQKTGYRLVAPVVQETAVQETVVQETRVPLAPKGLDVRGATDRSLEALLLGHEAHRLRVSHGPLGYAEALTLCEEAIGYAPDCGIVRAEHAINSAQLIRYCKDEPRKLAAALRMAEQAIDLDPELAHGYVAAGIVYSAMNNEGGAKRSFHRALSLNPNDGEAFFECSRSLLGFGDAVSAARAAERSASLMPVDYRPLYNAAAAHALAGDKVRSAKLVNATIDRVQSRLRIDPDEPRALNVLATLLAWRGDVDSGLSLNRALQARGQTILYYETAMLAFSGQTVQAKQGVEALMDSGYRQSGWIIRDLTASQASMGPMELSSTRSH